MKTTSLFKMICAVNCFGNTSLDAVFSCKLKNEFKIQQNLLIIFSGTVIPGTM
jgi:hypothetical protein